MPPTPDRRRHTMVDLRNRTSPTQSELGVITNAFRAALQYSPLTNPPAHHHDVYAYVSKEIQRRFWTDIYVERDEVRQIALALETGQLVLITGERGTGKSTAIQAVLRELAASERSNLLTFQLNANLRTKAMHSKEAAEAKIHEKVWAFLHGEVREIPEWLPYLYEEHPAFEELRNRLDQDRYRPPTPSDWQLVLEDDEYASIANEGMGMFSKSDLSDRIAIALQFIEEHTEFEPLLVIDNIDHLGDDVATHCGKVLASILGSSSGRVRGAIAVRTENADAIRYAIDNEPVHEKIEMAEKALNPDSFENPSIDLTFHIIRKRLAILREEKTIAEIRAAIDPERGSRLAADYEAEDLGKFFDSVMKLLEEMIYDVFRTNESDSKLRQASRKFAEAIHCWHNGSLRECGLSLTIFASDILQDKPHMFGLQSLLREVSAASGVESHRRRRHLRRVTLSLLYRHLLFWASSEEEKTNPPRNVMVFDADEETADPPLHFLRLRVLQYLAKCERGRTTISRVRRDIGELGINQERIDEALRDLAVKRSDDDAGLLRIDGLREVHPDTRLRGRAIVQLLDAGKFLVTDLYVTTEYLFWSAVTIQAAADAARLPTRIKPIQIQSDSFRTDVATRFLEKFLLEKFHDEHPYLRGYLDDWPPEKAKARMRIYERHFGFSKENWFLDHAAESVRGFIPSWDVSGRYAKAEESLERLDEFARSLDNIVDDSLPYEPSGLPSA